MSRAQSIFQCRTANEAYAAEKRALEKRRDAPYRSGTKCGWVKVKTQAWREANKGSLRVFCRNN